jgi:uncharacterized membrane protein
MAAREQREQLDVDSASLANVVSGVIGGALVAIAERRRSAAGAVAGVAGAGFILGALAPLIAERIVRAGARRRRVQLETTLIVDRPVRDVFAFCRDFENFPSVVSMELRVVDHQDGRAHWEVKSPSGELIEWDSEVTKFVPNVVIAWECLPGSPVECNGLIRFAPTASGGTKLHIDLQYEARHTGLTDAIHALLSTSREDMLRKDLARASFYLRSLPPGAFPSPDDGFADQDDARLSA